MEKGHVLDPLWIHSLLWRSCSVLVLVEVQFRGLSVLGEEFHLRRTVSGVLAGFVWSLYETLRLESGCGLTGGLWITSTYPSAYAFPLSLSWYITESAGSFQPLVVLHAYPASFAKRQCGCTAALCLLPWLCWHEPLLHQHKPCCGHHHQQCQPREDGALQGSPLSTWWEMFWFPLLHIPFPSLEI